MKDEPKQATPSTPNSAPTFARRQFLGNVVAGSAAGVVAATTGAAAAAAESTQDAKKPSALPPSLRGIANESGEVPDMGRVGGVAGSDFMVDVIKTLDIKYTPTNCASSFRAIHESLIDYGQNTAPEYISCMHEE